MHSKQALEKVSRARLIAALLFLLSVVKPAKKGSYKKAESILGLKGTKRASRTRGKGRKNSRAAKAMRYMRSHKVSLKEAWKHV